MKLVRDSYAKLEVAQKASVDDQIRLLGKKLIEESQEIISAFDKLDSNELLEECADVMELLLSICSLKDSKSVTPVDFPEIQGKIQMLMDSKRIKKGGFSLGIVLPEDRTKREEISKFCRNSDYSN